MISETIANAIGLCMRHNIPFAVYAYPGADELNFVASYPDADTGVNLCNMDVSSDWCGFMAGFFLQERDSIVGIRNQFNETDIVKAGDSLPMLPTADILPIYESTRYVNYLAELSEIVSSLKRGGGKTVLSRIINVCSTRSLIDIADEYFKKLSHTFRYLYFMQETGLWIGATPETLMSYEFDTQNISTMALAGTKLSDAEAWDDKNMDEHGYVVKYISSVFADFGITPDIEPVTEKKFGDIEHLCTQFHAKSEISPREFIGRMSPTPAVCGYPMKKAFEQILHYELHSRHCYGGWVGVKTASRIDAFVNLRCALIGNDGEDGYRYNIYAGGGLVKQSKAQDEWREGARKIQPLYEAIVGGVDPTSSLMDCQL